MNTCDNPYMPERNSFYKRIKLNYEGLEMVAEGYELDGIIKLVQVLNLNGNQICEDPTKDSRLDLIKNFQQTSANENVEKPVSVNLGDLGDKIRLPRTSSDFRCPKCHQSFVACITRSNGSDKRYIFRDLKGDKAILKKVNVENIIIKNPTDKDELVDLYKGLSELVSEDMLLVYENTEECTCPICHSTSTLSDWMDAYVSPLDYCDYDDICDICGSKGRIIMTEDTRNIECEDKCVSKALDKHLKAEENVDVDDDCEAIE